MLKVYTTFEVENEEGLFFDEYRHKSQKEKDDLKRRLIKGYYYGCGALKPYNKEQCQHLYEYAINKVEEQKSKLKEIAMRTDNT